MNSEIHSPRQPPVSVPLSRFVGYFLWLGTVGFGGPIALAGHMQQDLVDEKRWVSKQDYVEGLALAQLAPGPLAAQLAIYLGYVRAGVLGATAVGIAFILPSFLMVLALSAAYVRFGGLAWMQAMFYGIGADGKTYGLRSQSVKLSHHLNHKVTVWGTMRPESAEKKKKTGEAAEKGEPPEAGDIHVTNLKMVSDKCQ